MWILMISLYLTGSTGGVGFNSVEFSTKETCEAAGKAMVTEWGRGGLTIRDQGRWVCVRK